MRLGGFKVNIKMGNFLAISACETARSVSQCTLNKTPPTKTRNRTHHSLNEMARRSHPNHILELREAWTRELRGCP